MAFTIVAVSFIGLAAFDKSASSAD